MRFLKTWREARLIAIGAAALAATAAVAGYGYHAQSSARIAELSDELERSGSVLAKSDEIKTAQALSAKRIASLESRLFRSDKPSLASAEMQESFKSLAKRYGITVASGRPLPHVKEGPYTGVPVEFQFRAGLEQLTGLLIGLRDSPRLIGIRAISMRPAASGNGVLDIRLEAEGALKAGTDR